MKDILFNKPIDKSFNFQFDDKVAEVFDNMIKRSVPFYEEVQNMTVQLAERYYQKSSIIYDLGCSTANTIIKLAEQLGNKLQNKQISIIGIDSSIHMITRAKKKLAAHNLTNYDIDIFESNINNIIFKKNTSVVIMNYTLQFIQPRQRKEILDRIYYHLLPKGILILSEKIQNSNNMLNDIYTKFYQDLKHRNGYSELEIQQKRKTLENVLIPYTQNKNIALLEDVGFRDIDIFFKWYNFASYLAIKP